MIKFTSVARMSSTALVVGSSSSDHVNGTRKIRSGNIAANGKRHLNVESTQKRPTADEWPETYEEVYTRVFKTVEYMPVDKRLQWVQDRIVSYGWCIQTCNNINPHLYSVYVQIRNEAQEELSVTN